MKKFEDIQAFVAVVDTGSFTAAADRLKSAKSAISRRVSALERRLGVQLLRRTTRVLNLTDSGRSFYEHGKRILADLDEAEAAVQQLHGELHGILRVALPLSFGVRHMCGPISVFGKRHPNIRFELELNDRRVDLIGDNIDVALRIGPLSDSSLIARRLFDVRAVVCASPHYLHVHGAPETPDELSDRHCLVYSNLATHDNADSWRYEDLNGSGRTVKVNAVMTASSGDYLCNVAAHGQGLVFLPTFIAADSIRRGNLVPVLANYTWPDFPAHAVYPPARHLSFRVRAFVDFLVEKFSGMPSWDKDCGLARREKV